MNDSLSYLESLYRGCDRGHIVFVESCRNKVSAVFDVKRLDLAAQHIEREPLNLFMKINVMDHEATKARNPHGIGGADEVAAIVSLHLDVDAGKNENTQMRDKQSANKVLLKWEGHQRNIEIGIEARSQAAEPIEALLVRFITAKVSSGRSGQHIDRTVQLIRSVATHNGWKKLGDINAEGVNKYGQHLLKDSGHAARTVASMITAVRTFCKWCVYNGIMLADPTAVVFNPSVKHIRPPSN